MRLAIAGGGKIRRLVAQVETLVVAPINRSSAQTSAEQGLVIVGETAKEVCAVGHIRSILDTGKVQRRELSVELGKCRRARHEGRGGLGLGSTLQGNSTALDIQAINGASS